MRPWTIPIGAVALSLAIPAPADARPRFGPGMILGAFAAPLAMLSGGRSGAAQRHSAQRHQRVAEERSTQTDSTDGRRSERMARIERQATATSNPVSSGSVFTARLDDLLDYAFSQGKDEAFWTTGWRNWQRLAVQTDDPRPSQPPRLQQSATQPVRPGRPTRPMRSTAMPARSADQWIERIEQAIRRAPPGEIGGAVRRLVRASSGSTPPAPTPRRPRRRNGCKRSTTASRRCATLLTIRLPPGGPRLAQRRPGLAPRPRSDSRRSPERSRPPMLAVRCARSRWPRSPAGRRRRSRLAGREQQRANLEMLRMRLAGMAQRSSIPADLSAARPHGPHRRWTGSMSCCLP